MSTYLVAFIVSDYVGSRYNSDQFGTFARPDAQSHTNFSVEFGVKMVKELSEYFAMDYYDMQNVDKMHMAAIPDFSAGAMENWVRIYFH
jgi:aminopeptidase N